MTILERVDLLRKERGWSINYLAMEALLTQSTLNNLYIRKTEPKISTLRAICEAFGITLSQFFAGMEENGAEKSENNELYNRVVNLNADQKAALLTLLRAMR